MANKAYSSDGKRYTDSSIKAKLSEAYRKKYQGGIAICEETGERAEGSSHIISQKRCKHLHKTELIWDPDNFFPATHEVNRRWENNDKTLKNYWKYMEFVKLHDPEDYRKRINLR